MPADLLAALMIDCGCGERLLVGQALGAGLDGEAEAWRTALVEVAERLEVPLVWSADRPRCPRCGVGISTPAPTF